MIVARAARSNSAERQVVLADMQQCFVDANASGPDARNVEVLQGAVLGEGIDGQRPIVSVYIVDDFLPVDVGLYW